MNGEGCKCAAYHESECCCGVDWTTDEQLIGREAVKKLERLIDQLEAIIKEAKE